MKSVYTQMLWFCLIWASPAAAQFPKGETPLPSRCEGFVSKPCNYPNGCRGMTACNPLFGAYCSASGSTVACSSCGSGGLQQCDAFGGLSACQPPVSQAETCNSCDDDRNGVVDDQLDGTACTMSNGCSGILSCAKGQATCQFPTNDVPSTRSCSDCGPAGYQVCSGVGTELSKVSACRPPKTRPELDCNSCDDEGDGSTDTIYGVGIEQSCNLGGCSTSKCERGVWGACSRPQVEICNGIDDTCDALIDEGNVCGVSVGCACQPVACTPNFSGFQPDGCGGTLKCTGTRIEP